MTIKNLQIELLFKNDFFIHAINEKMFIMAMKAFINYSGNYNAIDMIDGMPRFIFHKNLDSTKKPVNISHLEFEDAQREHRQEYDEFTVHEDGVNIDYFLDGRANKYYKQETVRGSWVIKMVWDGSNFIATIETQDDIDLSPLYSLMDNDSHRYVFHSVYDGLKFIKKAVTLPEN
jgi:hypothetical protein